ncbi:hypothetical protein [Alkaliphilus transvaalensis]|uniref:hypothetical protein n=1 Tax=Alkaliphilus transvaalensis TaxID=114628 RepID=UPI00047A7E05|nr:hypothetical protein [Alkaliphilus transvaalensis]
MAQHFVNFSGEISLSDQQKLIQTIKHVELDDEIVIVMDSNDAHQADQIFSILEKNDYQVLPKGTEGGEKYQIYARKK